MCEPDLEKARGWDGRLPSPAPCSEQDRLRSWSRMLRAFASQSKASGNGDSPPALPQFTPIHCFNAALGQLLLAFTLQSPRSCRAWRVPAGLQTENRWASWGI